MSLPDGLTPKAFLQEYWQKKPLLLPAVLVDEIMAISELLTPETLAGLACEDDVEARLVVSAGTPDKWRMLNGPLEVDDFSALPSRGWTLLVQDVDKYIPQVAALREHFNFLPSWRIDDIMVSYATPGGTVGPHVDEYDVFLVQGAGTRIWEIGTSDGAVHGESPLSVVTNFTSSDSFNLQAGDALYLPPGVTHFGCSETPCMTFSVGFRAPSVAELILAEAEYRSERAHGRYSDANITLAEADDGLITVAAVERATGLLGRSTAVEDDMHWFGCLVTENKSWVEAGPPEHVETLAEFARLIGEGAVLKRELSARFARTEYPAPGMLFIDGSAWPLTSATSELARQLCGPGVVAQGDHGDEAIQFLHQLYSRGKLSLLRGSGY